MADCLFCDMGSGKTPVDKLHELPREFTPDACRCAGN